MLESNAKGVSHKALVENSKLESASSASSAAFPDHDPQKKTAIKILFLSSDTGGGHRASCESLAKQFQLLFPGSSYVLQDAIDGYFPMPKTYKHLSAHPTQWKVFYEVTNSRAFEMLADANMKLVCERGTRRKIMDIDPDVVISVHPLMTNVPQLSCAKISQKTGKHIPIFTVVTDLGSAHCLWFANSMEKMFVGSDQIWDLAKKRGNVPDEKLVKIGLPIRHDFALQAENLGDRISSEGKEYQKSIRQSLGLTHLDRPTLLVMGGGEGVGSLSNIVNSLYTELVMNGIDATILVVCGRNDKLKQDLKGRNWNNVLRIQSDLKATQVHRNFTSMCSGGAMVPSPTASCIEGPMTNSIRKILSSGSLSVASPLLTSDEKGSMEVAGSRSCEDLNKPILEVSSFEEKGGESNEPERQVQKDESSRSSDESITETDPLGNVEVIGLGFINNMAEYMVAADVLVSKAGPGTISEAAAVSLPVMLTSFLPGQEEGNVDFVLDGGFGSYINDSDPARIAEEVALWLRDEKKYENLCRSAKAKGAPYAARDIAKAIGDSTLKWKEINEENGKGSISSLTQ
mmetsp:Transcript_28943/g.43715  ORF Transcript_28943/g.43715 Transcript_28943/m.43715 type:complete len:573 (+) Transcript_28943:150-1868(+)|eukprot:CAMPEP_0178905606 /NCGR_PEP_ID=MMETSP0786-20121207/6369_1 /TAXON_ID=186022 /ORGANISM="Thalassionema frauenfeldii, Strain CCMP 1798" /LENGTH=572 /DNA_ID=CAMNT_0020577233 /DNA_START=133 /DNA_END=1851 /DNA_ORIENTATION=+